MYQLKIKAATLAAEARIIRHLERKTRDEIRRREAKALAVKPEFKAQREDLRHHRVTVVRRAARTTHLAYGFLRGTPYKKIEQKSYSRPAWQEVEKLINRYSPNADPRDIAQRFSEWKDAA